MHKVKQILLNAGGNIIYLACTWLMSVIVVRLADFDTAGIFSLALTITVVFYSISNYGIRSFQISDVREEYTDQEYMLVRILTCTVGYLLCGGYCIFKGYSSSQFSIVMLYMLFKTIEAFSDLSYGYFQKYNKFDYIFLSLTMKGIISIILFSITLFVTKNLIIALLAIIVGTLILYLAYDMYYTKRMVPALFGFDRITINKSCTLIKHTFLLMFINMMAPVLNAIPRIYFEEHTSAELFGYYFSISAPTVVISTFVGCALLPFIPKFAEYYEQQDVKSARKLLLSCVITTVLFGVLCYVVSLFLGDFALALLYTNEILQYSHILQGVIIATTCSALVMCFQLFLIAIRRLKYLAMTLVISCITAQVITPYLVTRFSMEGVSYTLIVAQIIQCAAMWLIIVLVMRQWKSELK